MPDFIAGLELGRRFYAEAVRPLLDIYFAEMPHAAGLIGNGSEVLGFDTAMSTDHDWGPTVILFVREADAPLKQPSHTMLSQRLPALFYGYPVHQQQYAADVPTTSMVIKTEPPFNYRVFVTTVREFAQQQLDLDPDQPLTAADWLTFPSQRLRSITAGAVYHDGVGELTALRTKLAFYPHDVWLYLLAASWQRIGQEEHLMPRAGSVGDEIGAAVIGARLVRDVMHLGFLMERQYAPYPKWFGTAFSQLRCADALSPLLKAVLSATTWQARETSLCNAYTHLARMHNQLQITAPQPEDCTHFFDRPFRVIHGEGFASALLSAITDPDVRRIAQKPLIGGIDHFTDNTDLRTSLAWRATLKRLFA